MNKRLPRITANELIKVLKKLNFDESRSSGSHRIFKSRDKTKRIVVPYHSGKIIHPKIIKDVLHLCSISVEDFNDLL